jgi:DNA-binding NtrC family response regulator
MNALGAEGAGAVWFAEWRDWLAAAQSAASGLALLCCRQSLPPALIEETRQRRSILPLVVVTDSAAESVGRAALRCGAADYFALSASASELRAFVRQCVAGRTPVAASLGRREPLIGASPGMMQVHEDIFSIARSDSNVLITGETGTGKELVASSIHYLSARHAQPLTIINCAAIPDGLFESELFGYERGAFTGAATSYEGKVKATDGGSIFLDEVGDLSPFAQAKLLRLLDTKEVQRLGDVRSYRVDVRIITATHRDLEAMVRDERFRSDLYFRLNVARVRVPALRERTTDIVPIAEHILSLLNCRLGARIEGFEHEALECLMRYAWPGNVRELRNVLESILIRRRSGRIGVADLPAAVREPQPELALPEDELSRMLVALASTEWNKSKAAEKLHWSRMTLYRKIAKYNVQSARKARAATAAGRDSRAAS